MSKMRAKTTVRSIEKQGDAQERLTKAAVAKSGEYGADGSDEDNTIAKYTPVANLQITIMNPVLVGTFSEGEAFYVGFRHPRPNLELRQGRSQRPMPLRFRQKVQEMLRPQLS